MNRFHATANGNIPFTEEEELEWDEKEQLYLIEVEKQNSIKYQFQRKEEYPPITDYIDGVVKGDQQQIQEYINKCLAVKDKYPKPEA
jgi:hypothetical protein